MILVTLDQVKQHLRVDTDDEDDDIELKANMAEEIVLNYLDGAESVFMDTSGELIDDVPFQVKAGVLLMVGELYANREQVSGSTYGRLPDGVVSVLYSL